MDPPQDPDWEPMPEGARPMLATPGDLPSGDEYAFEIHWSGARVIVLFPRPAVAPPRPWWRRALRWLRYGTSGIWRARPGQVEPRAARVRERPSRRLRTRVG